ncbi:MAG TPA: GNVR domain-containing protein [Spirochaetales bacterium]|nr:GNVR domain-containing protein [Spirochaetales bacterium]
MSDQKTNFEGRPEQGQVEQKKPDNKDDDEISLLDLVAVLWKRRKIIIWVTVLAVVLSLAYAMGSLMLPPEKSYLPNVYTPKATMLISSGTSSSLSSMLSSSGLSGLAGMAGISAGGNPNQQLAQVLATSNTTLDRLNQKFDLTAKYKITKEPVSGTRKAILNRLSAKIDDKSNVFTISFTDKDPVLAKQVVDETVNILSERFAQLSGSKALEQKALLEKRLADVDAAINDLEAQVKAFQKKYGTVQVEALTTEQVTILARLRSELILKEMDIENYKKVSKINDPTMMQLNNERDALLAKIKELETGSGSGTKVMPSQQQMPTIAFEYAKLERDLAVQTELYKILTQQYEVAKFSAAGQEPVFQIIEMAEVPDTKSGPARSTTVIVASLAGFFVSVLIAFAVESLSKIRHDPEAMARFRAISQGKEPVDQ